MKELILEMEEYASLKNIPIIEKDSITFIMKYIKKTILKYIRNRQCNWLLYYFNGQC